MIYAAASVPRETSDDAHVKRVVDAKGRVWGWQWRRHFGDVSEPIPSLMGRYRERFAMLSGPGERRFLEVFLGDGLEFATALKSVSEKRRETAYIHYVIALPAKTKAAQLAIDPSTYWQRVSYMRAELAKALDLS